MDTESRNPVHIWSALGTHKMLFRLHESASSVAHRCLGYEDTGGVLQDRMPERLRTDTDRIISRVVKNQVTVVLPVLNEAEAITSVIDEIEAEG